MILGRIEQWSYDLPSLNRIATPFQLRKFILRYIYTNLFPRET